MSKKLIFAVYCLGLLACQYGMAFCQWPDLGLCTAVMPNVEEATPVLFVIPNGTGTPLTEALIFGTLETVDATIELTIVDPFGHPIAGVPREELSLWSYDGNFGVCDLGAHPEQDTDENGHAYWTLPPKAYGANEGELFVLLNGALVGSTDNPLPLRVNSADINGDGQVNIVDVGQFSQIFFGSYDFSADYLPDGVLNLADVSRLAMGFSTHCIGWK